MSVADGFKVVPMGNRVLVFAEIFDAAASCADGQCAEKEFESSRQANSAALTLRRALARSGNPRWEGLKVAKRGCSVLVYRSPR